MIYFVDIGLIVLIIVVAIIVFLNAGSIVLAEGIPYIETPVSVIFLVVNLIFLILFVVSIYHASNESRSKGLVSSGLYIVGKAIRVLIEFIFLKYTFIYFCTEMIKSQEDTNGFFSSIFALISFIGMLVILLVCLCVSGLIDSYTPVWIEDYDMSPIVAGVLSLSLSIVYFIILQTLIGIDALLYKETVEKVGILVNFMSEPILFRIFG